MSDLDILRDKVIRDQLDLIAQQDAHIDKQSDFITELLDYMGKTDLDQLQPSPDN